MQNKQHTIIIPEILISHSLFDGKHYSPIGILMKPFFDFESESISDLNFEKVLIEVCQFYKIPILHLFNLISDTNKCKTLQSLKGCFIFHLQLNHINFR